MDWDYSCACVCVIYLFIYFYQKHVNTATSGSRALCTGPTPLSTSTHWPCYGTVSGSHVLFTRPTNLTFQQLFSLKMGHTVLFTHLKIILLQYFQFSIFSFSKISSIQIDPKNHLNLGSSISLASISIRHQQCFPNWLS